MFTAFEHQMISLLYLLACLFQEIQVIKPGTSKSGNSEAYVVCLAFIGKEKIPSSVMEKVCEGYGEHCPSSSLFSLSSIPCTFLERLKACEEYFTSLQMEAIDQNIKQFYYMSSREWKAHAQLRQLVVENFVERFHVRPINEEEHVVAGAYLDGTQLSFTRGPTNNVPFRESFNGRHQMGSYNERNENLNQEWLAKTLADGQFQFHPTQLKSLQDYSQVYNEVPLIPLHYDQVVWLEGAECVTPEVMAATWKPQSAACLNAVLNSRFCTPFYISKLQDAHQQATILREENVDNLISINDKVCPSNIVKMSKGGEAEVRNLDNLIFFTEMAKCDNFGIVLNLSDSLDYLGQYLQEKRARFNSIRLCISAESGTPLATINQETAFQFEDISQHVNRVSQIGDEQKINLVFADLNHSNELSAKRELVSLCITALKLLGDGGMFVCRVCETLTRFSVGLLYIFHHIFDKLTIVKPVMSQLSSPQRFLVCKGFHGDNKHYAAYLEEVLHQLTMLANEGSAFDVVEIVPMQLLYGEQFYTFVKQMNEQLAHVQLQTVVQLENYFLYPDKMPSAEEIFDLREEVTAYLK